MLNHASNMVKHASNVLINGWNMFCPLSWYIIAIQRTFAVLQLLFFLYMGTCNVALLVQQQFNVQHTVDLIRLSNSLCPG